jgi:DNA-binding LytR/AlgR family response regulator
MKLNCLIVDDEPLAIELIISHIKKIPDLDVVAVCSNAIEAGDLMKQLEIDLLFLDVQMPQMTGFEFLRTLQNPPAIIITTAHRDHAMESYEFDVVDFLLKPIFFDRFLKAINKVFSRKGIASELTSEQTVADSFDAAYMYFKVDREMVKVLLSQILWIESMKDYVKIKTQNQGQLVTYQRISYLEEKLPETHFVRIHRSFIVNQKHITAFNSTSVTVIGKVFPIGRLHKNKVLHELQKDVTKRE